VWRAEVGVQPRLRPRLTRPALAGAQRRARSCYLLREPPVAAFPSPQLGPPATPAPGPTSMARAACTTAHMSCSIVTAVFPASKRARRDQPPPAQHPPATARDASAPASRTDSRPSRLPRRLQCNCAERALSPSEPMPHLPRLHGHGATSGGGGIAKKCIALGDASAPPIGHL
jgi:hypothetical protein